LAIGLASRAGLVLVAYLSLALMPLNPDPSIGGPGNQWRSFPQNLFLDGWARWDSGWYNGVAQHGYSYIETPEAIQQNIVFFPLYPLAMRLFGGLIGSTYLAGILISNVAFLIALLLLYFLVLQRFDESVAFRTVVLLSVYPFAFYYGAVYSESVFFMFVVGAFFFADKECWWGAALCGMLAGATRLPGLVMFPVLIIVYLEKIHFSWRRVRPDVLWILLSVVGPLLYFAYLYVRFEDPWLYFEVERAPGWWLSEQGANVLTSTWQQFWSVPNLLTGNYPVSYVWNLLTGILFCLTVFSVFRRQGWGAGLFAVTMLVVGATQWINIGRYAMPVFPVFIAWAQWLSGERRFVGIVIVSTLLLAMWTIAFTHWYWVT